MYMSYTLCEYVRSYSILCDLAYIFHFKIYYINDSIYTNV